MSIRNLDHLLRPRSVAVIGATDRPQSVGGTVMRNLLAGGFSGPVFPVNPRHATVAGLASSPDVAHLPEAPDLAVICTPPATVPGLIHALGARGSKAAVVLTAGLDAATKQAMLDAARPHLLRILGPNCVGLLVPGIGLNASFAHTQALRGHLGFLSQSGALVTAVLDWARSRAIGFSHFVSLGERADVDFGDLIDYLGSDPGTRAILLYIESIRTARKFMSAARAAARNKPIIVVKAGRAPAGARAAASHTGALAGADDVFDAALRRAGMLRVDSMLDLFDAVETLARVPTLPGERLMIVTNGGGAGVMAADAAALHGIVLAEPAPATLERLERMLPANWSHGNPIDIIGDAPVERYVGTLEALIDDPGCDAILFIHAPTAIVPSDAIAEACVAVARRSSKPVLSCWLGDEAVARARRIFQDAGIAHYGTPEQAVRGFEQLVTWRRNQAQLLEVPPSRTDDATNDTAAVQAIVAHVLADGRDLLTEPEAKSVLAAYGIPVVATSVAHTTDEAVSQAASKGFPVALKILSRDITHKSDVGGVALGLTDAEAVRKAADAMLARVRALRPEARIDGFTVQGMVVRPGAHELIAGMTIDPQFGPVLLFGQGGTAVEVIGDRAVALPPLNVRLASELISRTRIAKLLAGYRDRPPVDHAALHRVLERLSQLVMDVPEVIELDINPLLADAQGAIALDARVRVARATSTGADRLAIRPYPRELEETVVQGGHPVLLRPIRPEDAAAHLRFLARLDPEDVRLRVFYTRRHIAPSELARLTQLDYEREMAFIVAGLDNDEVGETLGVVRISTDPDNLRAEFGILVRSDLKGRGLGHALLDKMIRYCRARGTGEIFGDVLRENRRMLELARTLGFAIENGEEPGVVRVRLAL